MFELCEVLGNFVWVIFIVIEFVLVIDYELFEKIFYFYIFAQTHAWSIETKFDTIACQVSS
jgi:hypothetical protein